MAEEDDKGVSQTPATSSGFWVQLGAAGTARQEFRTHEDFQQWLNQINTSWKWLQAAGDTGRSMWQRITARLNEITQVSASAHGLIIGSEPDPGIASTKLRKVFGRFQDDWPWVFPGNALHDWLESLRQTPDMTPHAAAIVGLLMRSKPGDESFIKHFPNTIQIEAHLMLKFFNMGLEGRGDAELSLVARAGEELAKLSGDLRDELRSARDQTSQQQLQHHASLKAFEDLRLGHAETYSDDKRHREKQWDEFQQRTEAEQKALLEAFTAHMQLQAPVGYWEEKRRKHKNLAWYTGSATVAWMLSAATLIYCKMPDLPKSLVPIDPKAAASAAADPGELAALQLSWDNLAHVGGLVLLSTLMLWVMRVLMRVFLSHLHLEMDAAERVTMVTTYLAMIKDEAMTRDGEAMKAVVAALFRPTGDGIVKDEGLPQITVAELLSRSK